jgi:hypothetical protein
MKTRRNVMQDSIDERVGEITAQQSLSKLFKPFTEKLKQRPSNQRDADIEGYNIISASLSCNKDSN